MKRRRRRNAILSSWLGRRRRQQFLLLLLPPPFPKPPPLLSLNERTLRRRKGRNRMGTGGILFSLPFCGSFLGSESHTRARNDSFEGRNSFYRTPPPNFEPISSTNCTCLKSCMWAGSTSEMSRYHRSSMILKKEGFFKKRNV